MATCQGCGKAIQFVVTPGGKKMPVNVEPIAVVVTKGGPLRVVLDDGSVVAARACVEGDAEHPGTNVVEARTSHFSDCPRAERFRAKGRTAP